MPCYIHHDPPVSPLLAIMNLYRIAIIECDVPPKPILDKYGAWGEIIEQYVRCGLKAYEHVTDCVVPRVVVTDVKAFDMAEAFPDDSLIDCIIVTGNCA